MNGSNSAILLPKELSIAMLERLQHVFFCACELAVYLPFDHQINAARCPYVQKNGLKNLETTAIKLKPGFMHAHPLKRQAATAN